jgi:hypothetical protein
MAAMTGRKPAAHRLIKASPVFQTVVSIPRIGNILSFCAWINPPRPRSRESAGPKLDEHRRILGFDQPFGDCRNFVVLNMAHSRRNSQFVACSPHFRRDEFVVFLTHPLSLGSDFPHIGGVVTEDPT